jgi:hypothetical protein
MTAPDADGWIKHNGGLCPVPQYQYVEVEEANGEFSLGLAVARYWPRVKRYRIVDDDARLPAQSPFVRETAARIMAAGTWNSDRSLEEDAAFSVKAAKALEAALKGARG